MDNSQNQGKYDAQRDLPIPRRHIVGARSMGSIITNQLADPNHEPDAYEVEYLAVRLARCFHVNMDSRHVDYDPYQADDMRLLADGEE